MKGKKIATIIGIVPRDNPKYLVYANGYFAFCDNYWEDGVFLAGGEVETSEDCVTFEDTDELYSGAEALIERFRKSASIDASSNSDDPSSNIKIARVIAKYNGASPRELVKVDKDAIVCLPNWHIGFKLFNFNGIVEVSDCCMYFNNLDYFNTFVREYPIEKAISEDFKHHG